MEEDDVEVVRRECHVDLYVQLQIYSCPPSEVREDMPLAPVCGPGPIP